MKRRFLVLGTVLIIGNVAFAVTVERPETQNRQESLQQRDDSHSRLSGMLEAKGLEREAAVKKASLLTADAPFTFDNQLHTLFTAHSGLDAEKTYDYLARQALFGKRVDLASYDALLRLVHAVEGKHPETATRDTLKRVARLNAAA